ncbi:hypothetical protein [Hyalangium versicolor]|uniref:hypothetical protein n=1 Tax=Hyalangium versicolor TaxID=2861190 RepID=UPI001CCDC0CB|nr:hypothetical protein [Hyalangium versicolor]
MSPEGPERDRRSLGDLGLLVGLTVGAFVVRFARLLESPEPPGTDGYYYIVQVQHLIAEGRLHVPDASWVLRLLGLAAWLVGEPIRGVKGMSALLAAACVPAAWFAGTRLARASASEAPSLDRERLAGWVMALWAAASPTLMHLAGDFPKTLGAVAPLLIVLGWGATARRGFWAALGGTVALLLAATAHRLGASMLGLGGVGALLGLALRGRREAPERKWPLLVAGGAALLGFIGLTRVLPNLLHPGDLGRVSTQLDLSLGVPLPFAAFRLRTTHPVQQVELAATWAGLFLGLVLLWRRRALRPLVSALLLPLAVCLFPLWRRDVLDLGYRLSLLAPLPAVALAVLALPARLSVLVRSRSAMIVSLALVLVARWGFDPTQTPPYARYRKLIERIPRPLPELLIAHQGINFLYGHLTWHEAMAWAPEQDLDRTRIGRIVWGVRDGEWITYAPVTEGLPTATRLDSSYLYVREDVFEAFLARVKEEGDEELIERLRDWRNPSQIRPVSMLRNRD